MYTQKILILLIGFSFQFAQACSCHCSEKIEEELYSRFKHVDFVASAVAVEVKIKSDGSSNSENVAWKIAKKWKGDLQEGNLITSSTFFSAAFCGRSVKVGESLVLYFNRNNLPFISGCSRCASFEEEERVLSLLKSGYVPIIPEKPTKPILIVDTFDDTYPESALAQGIEGFTNYQAEISEKGAVVKVFLSKTSGSEILDEETIKRIKKVKFKPATLNGKPIPSLYQGKKVWRLTP